MASGILCFEKNKIDLDNESGSITITDAIATDNGQSYVDYLRNRNNYSGWSTSDSTDAANTTLTVSFGDEKTITDIILVEQNFKAYTIKYWNGATYVDFSTVIAETTNTAVTKHHNFDAVSTTEIQIIVTGAMTVDDDKRMAQLIVTQRLGQFTLFPRIKNPIQDKDRRTIKLISGKQKVIRSIGAFAVSLQMDDVVTTADLTLIETIYDQYNGFLLWLCGGDETQFRTERIGYRLEDIYLVACKNEWVPEINDGFYSRGTAVEIDLVEVI